MIRKNEYVRFDWAIKNVLRDKANFEILEGLVSVLLREPIKIVELLESEANQQDADDKFNRVDVKAKNEKGELILVEVQLTNQLHYLERILYGVSKTISEHMSLGDDYSKVKKVYSISILYCNYGTGKDYVYHGVTRFKGLHIDDELTVTSRQRGVIEHRFPHEVFPEYYIIRVNNFDKIAESPLDEWMEYLKSGIIKEETTAPGLQMAKRKLNYLSMSQSERKAYEHHIDAVVFQDDCIASAREEGEFSKALKIARNLKNIGMDNDSIANVTGLSLREIEDL